MSRVKSNMYNLLGASSKLGNPIRFFGSISTGIWDLFKKPIERKTDGTLAIGAGIAEGTESFFTKSIEGAFGT